MLSDLDGLPLNACLIVIVGDEEDENECLNRYESWMVLVSDGARI